MPHERLDKLMQRLRVRFPKDFYLRPINSCVEVVRSNRKNALQSGGLPGIFAQHVITLGNLLEDENVVWIQLQRALQIARRLLPATLPAVDITAPLERSWIVR